MRQENRKRIFILLGLVAFILVASEVINIFLRKEKDDFKDTFTMVYKQVIVGGTINWNKNGDLMLWAEIIGIIIALGLLLGAFVYTKRHENKSWIFILLLVLSSVGIAYSIYSNMTLVFDDNHLFNVNWAAGTSADAKKKIMDTTWNLHSTNMTALAFAKIAAGAVYFAVTLSMFIINKRNVNLIRAEEAQKRLAEQQAAWDQYNENLKNQQ